MKIKFVLTTGRTVIEDITGIIINEKDEKLIITHTDGEATTIPFDKVKGDIEVEDKPIALRTEQ